MPLALVEQQIAREQGTLLATQSDGTRTLVVYQRPEEEIVCATWSTTDGRRVGVGPAASVRGSGIPTQRITVLGPLLTDADLLCIVLTDPLDRAPGGSIRIVVEGAMDERVPTTGAAAVLFLQPKQHPPLNLSALPIGIEIYDASGQLRYQQQRRWRYEP